MHQMQILKELLNAVNKVKAEVVLVGKEDSN